MIYDIIVVGAGPAGCSSAFFSKFFDKENKLDVLLLESLSNEKYKKYHKMCGECVSDRLFKEISPIKPGHITERLKRSEEYVGDFVIRSRIRGYIIDRPNFLLDIIEKFKNLGGEYLSEVAIVDIAQKKDYIEAKTAKGKILKTKYLIAADGAGSLIRKKMKMGDIKSRPALQYIIDKEPDHDVLRFYYDEIYEGDYKWVFPNGATTKVGFPFIPNKNFKVEGKIITRQGRIIGYGGIEQYVKENVLLVGDAAGQTNALSKGGIRPGMNAGKMAARAILGGNPEEYARLWKNSLFSSQLINNAFEIIKRMNNKEIADHLKPFKDNFLFALIRILFFKKYKKYSEIYKAYALERKIGW